MLALEIYLVWWKEKFTAMVNLPKSAIALML